MGRATRWLKGLFGMNKKENPSYSGDRKDRKASSFSQSERAGKGSLCHNPATIPPNITPAEVAWLRSFYGEPEKEQSKHAIAVAAATAAAADAAVAAAQAAVAVVRLTSQGRGTMFNGSREKWAAIRIQTVFRGFLARKARRALKGVVKVQALVRGYLVRKQAYATLYSMEALIRAQANARAQKAKALILNAQNCPPQFRPRKSMEKFDDLKNEFKITRHRRRLSASMDTNVKDFDEFSKIVEVDPGKPKYRSRSKNKTCIHEYEDNSYSQSRVSIQESRNYHESEFSSAQSTPRFANSWGSNAPATPAKSVCVEGYFRDSEDFPSYMANTQSFKAKLRSQSAPKQRPEKGSKRRPSLNEMMESRSSLSGVRMQRSCSKAQEVVHFKNAVMGKLGISSNFVNEEESFCIHGKW